MITAELYEVCDCSEVDANEIINQINTLNDEQEGLNSFLAKKHEMRMTGFLSIEIIRKMLKKFLEEKKTPKIELSKILGISEAQIDQLFFYDSVPRLIKRINLPLIKLF